MFIWGWVADCLYINGYDGVRHIRHALEAPVHSKDFVWHMNCWNAKPFGKHRKLG